MHPFISAFLEADKLGFDVSAMAAQAVELNGVYHSHKKRHYRGNCSDVKEVSLSTLIESPESFCPDCFYALKVDGMRAESWANKFTDVIDAAARNATPVRSFDNFLTRCLRDRSIYQVVQNTPSILQWAQECGAIFDDESRLRSLTPKAIDELHMRMLIKVFTPPQSFSQPGMEEVLEDFIERSGVQIAEMLDRPGWSLVASSGRSTWGAEAEWGTKLYHLNDHLVMIPTKVLPYFTASPDCSYVILDEPLTPGEAETLAVLFKPMSRGSAYNTLEAALTAARSL